MKIDQKRYILIDCMTEYVNGYALVVANRKYGVLDMEGNIVIPFEYDSIGTYAEGLFPANKDAMSGYIDINNRWKIEPIYRFTNNFSEGLACVKKDGCYGYINTRGEIIIPIKYIRAKCFSEGLAFVEIEDSKYGFIDKQGTLVFETNFKNVSPFCNDLAIVNDVEKELCGAIDRTGKLIVPIEYADIDTLENYIWACLPDESAVYFDKQGNLMDDIDIESVNKDDETWTIEIKGDLVGIVDTAGGEILPCQYEDTFSFNKKNETLIVIKDEKYGILSTKTWQEVLPIKYREITYLNSDRYILCESDIDAQIVDDNFKTIFSIQLSDVYYNYSEIILEEILEDFRKGRQELIDRYKGNNNFFNNIPKLSDNFSKFIFIGIIICIVCTLLIIFICSLFS